MSNKQFYMPNFYQYERDFLENFLFSLYKWEGLPDSLDARYLEMLLQTAGYAVGTEYNSEVIAVSGALIGFDRQRKPTSFESANVPLPSFTRTIDKDCFVCYNKISYWKPKGNDYIIHIFATKLAQLDISEMTSLYNSRVALLFKCQDEKEAQRARLFYDKLSQGYPSIIDYKTSIWQNESESPFVPIKAKDNIISSELADARRSVLADFCTAVGVDCIAVDKKERTNYAEMDSNKQLLQITGGVALEARKIWAKKMNTAYGLNISVSLKGDDINDMRNASEEPSVSDTVVKS